VCRSASALKENLALTTPERDTSIPERNERLRNFQIILSDSGRNVKRPEKVLQYRGPNWLQTMFAAMMTTILRGKHMAHPSHRHLREETLRPEPKGPELRKAEDRQARVML
jgi:hypothetical protein